MALLTRKELLEKTAKPSWFITNYEKRGHLVFSKTDDGKSLFDTDFPLNKSFLAKWNIEGKETKGEEKISEDVKTPKSVKGLKSPKDKPAVNHGTIRLDPQKEAAYNLTQEIKQIELEQAKQDLELAKYRAAKLHGDVIPVDLVINVFSQHTKMVVTEYRNSADKMLSQIAIMHKLSNAEVAQLKTIINKEINLAGEKSLNESLKNIGSIQEGYSLKRGRGERN